ncbi:hypothetical protein GLOTRDRAFT_141510 [Gloeophyllum trabeum ATCC 11539]|uniref:Uncharacterized protein n=1 Tax=Gloeophyllum trabeum (strain ATCC 11539 / FP-39264 / Madison 617) TaxID=670483 RepID=S7RDA5_GLOTA|nr:uncharacterized protein GLOTRDRAFT_141510 [Gloeophyllum trabeum ATCC 11539]EPQ50409.1 hypothetical protein GLOTRDRAFT_141510 [Gloeophyllum trabeum ATCC 11539]
MQAARNDVNLSTLQLSSSTVEHATIAPARTASWVRNHSSANVYRAPSQDQRLVPSMYLKDEEEDRRTIASLPPRMLMKYGDGRPDEIISAEYYINGRNTRRVKQANGHGTQVRPAKRLPTTNVHAPPMQQSVSHPPSTSRHPHPSSYNTLPRHTSQRRPASTISNDPLPVPPPGFSKSLSESSNGRSHVRSSSVPFPNGHQLGNTLDTRFLESRSVGGDGIGAGSNAGVPASILESTVGGGRQGRRRGAGRPGHARMASDSGPRVDPQSFGNPIDGPASVTAGNVNANEDKASVAGTEVTNGWYLLPSSSQLPSARRQPRPQNRRTLTKPPPGSGGSRRSRSQSVSSTNSAKGKEREKSPVSPMQKEKGKGKEKEKPLPVPPASSSPNINPGPPPSNSSFANMSMSMSRDLQNQPGPEQKPQHRARAFSSPSVPTFGLGFGRRRASEGQINDAEGKGSGRGRPFFRRFFTTSLDRARAMEDVEAARAPNPNSSHGSHRKLVKSRPGLGAIPGFGPEAGPAMSNGTAHSQATSNATGHSQALERPGMRPRSYSLDSGSFVMMSPPSTVANLHQRWRGPPTTVAPSTYNGSEYMYPQRPPREGPLQHSMMSMAGAMSDSGHGHTANGANAMRSPNPAAAPPNPSTSHGRSHSAAQTQQPMSVAKPPSRAPSIQSAHRVPFTARDYDVHPWKSATKLSHLGFVVRGVAADCEAAPGSVVVSQIHHASTAVSLTGGVAQEWIRRRKGSEGQAKADEAPVATNDALPPGSPGEAGSESLSRPEAVRSNSSDHIGRAARQSLDAVPAPSSTFVPRGSNGTPPGATVSRSSSQQYSRTNPSPQDPGPSNQPGTRSYSAQRAKGPSRSDFERLYTTTVPTPPPKDVAAPSANGSRYTASIGPVDTDSRFPRPSRGPVARSVAAEKPKTSSRQDQVTGTGRPPVPTSQHPWDPTMRPHFYEDRSRKSIGGASQVSWNMKPITITRPPDGISQAQTTYYSYASPQAAAQGHLEASRQHVNGTSRSATHPPPSASATVNGVHASVGAPQLQAFSSAYPQAHAPRGMHQHSPSAPSNYSYSYAGSVTERPANGNGFASGTPELQAQEDFEPPVIPSPSSKSPFFKRLFASGAKGKGMEPGTSDSDESKKAKKTRGLSAESAAWR